jgi:hypothetical protein
VALPSAVTLASVTVVVAAGVGLAAAAARSVDTPGAASHASGPGRTIVQHHPRTVPQHPSPGDRANRHTAGRPARHRSGDAVPKVLVEVYNNSAITGLAATEAAVLEGAGWKVAVTANWTGQIPANTVYYPDGLRRDAKRLAALLQIDRLRPAVAPMQFDRLTVIVVSS